MSLNPAAVVALGLILAQSTTQDCRQTPRTETPAPAPANPNPAQPPSEVITTQDGARVQVQVVVTNLEIPWSMAFAPDGRLFVTERPGRVRIVNVAGGTSELAVTLDDTFAQGEAGTLGLALDPDFASSRFVYVYYTARAGSGAVNRVVRYREVGGRLGERAVLLDGIPADTIHDGGRIRFGPDGLLYVSTGDASTQSLSQSLGSLAGKILRINRDGTIARREPLRLTRVLVRAPQPPGLRLAPRDRRTVGLGARLDRQRRDQRDTRRRQLWLADDSGQPDHAGHDHAGDLLQPGDCALGRVVLSRARDPAVREQPVRRDAAGRAPAAAAARSLSARPHRGPGASPGPALWTHQGRDRGAGRVPVLLHQQPRRQREPGASDDLIARFVPAS